MKMTDETNQQSSSTRVAILKIVFAGVTTICVAIAAAVTAILTDVVSLGITAWVATAIIGTAAMLSSAKNS
tara:strand:- start:582 stop:794 length:213 start_codon:yes stop_codon:yes gene_type:complete